MTSQDLREFRKRMGWIQTELANALEVSLRTLARWENEGGIPKTVELAVKYIEERYPPSKPKELIEEDPFFDDFFRPQKKNTLKNPKSN